MKTDSYFQIGKEHTVCQDYTLHGTSSKGISYIIVSDGCSASPDVDVGARLLALSAKKMLLTNKYTYDVKSYADFGHDVINNIGHVFNYLDFHPKTFDATLLVAWIENGTLTAYLYGDGVFIHKNAKGDVLTSIHIDFTNNAPSYLSYHLDHVRMNLYKNAGGMKHVQTNGGLVVAKPFDAVMMQCNVVEGDIISLCSDGINSFKKENDEPIDWKDLINEYTCYKTTEGVFVRRRMQAFKRQCIKENIVHTDDISIASIIVDKSPVLG